jgi:uncharacterized BrkB/YihY/UPF0761 family membrane protein
MKKNNLSRHAIGLLVGLTVLYLLGISANIFVSFPATHNQKDLWQFAMQQLPISAHIVVGLLLFIGLLALLIRAVILKEKRWSLISSVGLVAFIAGSYSGQEYIATQQNWFSFIMAFSFIIVYLSLYIGIYQSKNNGIKD